jgi:hypothetical protein
VQLPPRSASRSTVCGATGGIASVPSPETAPRDRATAVHGRAVRVGLTLDQVTSGVARLKEAMEQDGREGVDVHYLDSNVVRSEGSVFCLFHGSSQESVKEANRRARFPFHRVVEAVVLR